MKIEHYWNIKCYSKDGVLRWEEVDKPNSLANQGGFAILEAFYQQAASLTIGGNGYPIPTNFYIRLCNYSPLVTDTLLTIENEPLTNFYGAQVIPASAVGFPTIDTAPDGNPRLTSTVVTFSATGVPGQNIGPVITAFLATTGGTTNGTTGVFTPNNTGLLIGFLPLSTQRTILAGDFMTYQFYCECGNS